MEQVLIGKQYFLVIDAGSTGTRMHVFEFQRSDLEVRSVLSEKFMEVKPGLSSYDSDPVQAAESLRPLMDLALQSVPSSLHSCTGLILRATAGMRILPSTSADLILKECWYLLAKEYPFPLLGRDAVTIMTGSNEGITAHCCS